MFLQLIKGFYGDKNVVIYSHICKIAKVLILSSVLEFP